MRDIRTQAANREGVADALTPHKARVTMALWKQRARANTITLILGGWLLASCGNGAVAADTANPEVVFDGTGCVYDGPAEITKGGIEFTLVNESTTTIDLLAIGFDDPADFEAEIDLIAVGTDSGDVGELPRGAFVEVALNAQAGEENTALTLLDTGSYVLDCAHIPPTDFLPDHIWRAATFEIVP